ncbi:CAP domain-containing protein [Mucilaginibacter terrae]|uniref:CAP domain-containing protein n=1 Tax=Mucilaginibacter terrae TaxID=1955052 RepID=UPI00364343E8
MVKIGLLCSTALLVLTGASGIKPTTVNEIFKNEFLNRINKVRQQGCKCGTVYMPPVGPLVWNDVLTDAAEGHAKDMSKRSYFSHTGKNGSSIEDRIKTAGYTYNGYKSFAIGENIAFGQETIAEVSNGWFKSVGHCKNLMNADFKEIGIAEYNKYWVQDFGGREAFTVREKELIKSGRLIIRRSAVKN